MRISYDECCEAQHPIIGDPLCLVFGLVIFCFVRAEGFEPPESR